MYDIAAIRSGLELAIEGKWYAVLVESDSLLTVSICNSTLPWNGNHQALVFRIRQLLALNGATIRHIPREVNRCAN